MSDKQIDAAMAEVKAWMAASKEAVECISTLKAQLEVVSRERDEFCALWKARTDDVDELKQQIAELQKENTELKSERIKFLRNAYVMVGRILRVEGENEQLKEWREGFLSERTGV